MPAAPSVKIHRFEVSPRGGAGSGAADPIGESVRREALAMGIAVSGVRATHVYLVRAALSDEQRRMVADRLLADPITERCECGAAASRAEGQIVEVHPLPGVMDPVAQSVELAVRDLVGERVKVSTGWRYDLEGVTAEQAEVLAKRLLANPVIQRIEREPWRPAEFVAAAGHEGKVRSIAMLELGDEQLVRLSREAHLFLSLEEMQAIQAEYRRLGRDPRDIELETLAQTWSEHCVHKTLKSRVRYRRHAGTEARRDEGEAGADPIEWSGRPGHTVRADGSVEIENLLKSTVAAATRELIAEGVDWTLSVFVDNSGVVAFDDAWGVCIKVETHNHPSAIEPYGGAATGIGGCIRDVIGTGLGARPIANTDVFCVAWPGHFASDAAAEGEYAEDAEVAEARREQIGPSGCEIDAKATGVDGFVAKTGLAGFPPSASLPDFHSASSAYALDRAKSPGTALPPGCLHPRRVLSQVVAGVRDYGNRMGIPTVNGAVAFDDRYVGNPLVFCGCIGVIPRDKISGRARPGDRIIALGGRTGRDGIHGATFSSAELEHTASDEFAHAVQIGNAITEKQVLEAVIRARDEDQAGPLYHGMTDCGAGGFSSAVGEMGKDLGAEVHLDRAPLKYAGLSYTEVWISEAQERMVLAVPAQKVALLAAICKEEGVEMADLGHFGTPGAELVLFFHGDEVGRMGMHFLHEGIPMPTREAVWKGSGRVAEWLSGKAKAHAHAGDAATATTSTLPLCNSATSGSATLPLLLRHPNIASKHWIIRQYDHEVRGNTVIKPLVGPLGRGPGDASVLEVVPGSARAIAVGCGLQTGLGDPELGGDPYLMALAAIDECVRNCVCVGADPSRLAILDNFCWPSCGDEAGMASLVRACAGCYDGAKAYRTPFVSGKDSLNNQLTIPAEGGRPARTMRIPPTLLITGLGIVPDARRAVTMDAKTAGNLLVLVGETGTAMGGSVWQQMCAGEPVRCVGGPDVPSAVNGAIGGGADIPSASDFSIPRTNLVLGPAIARAVHAAMKEGLVRSAHDCSEGGLAVAIAEMLIAGSVPAARRGGANAPGGAPMGAEINLGAVQWIGGAAGSVDAALYAETPSRYVLEVRPEDAGALRTLLAGVPHACVGRLDWSGRLRIPLAGMDHDVETLAAAWRGPLDW